MSSQISDHFVGVDTQELPVITAADGPFDLQTIDAPHKRIVAADAIITNAPLGFTTGGDFLWEYHSGATDADGYWTLDVFAFSGDIEPTQWISQRKASANSGWFLAKGGIATVADQATLVALPQASLVDGDARSHGRTTYVWHAALTPEQADGLPTLEPNDKANLGVDAGYWVQQVPELSSSFGDFRTSRTLTHTFGDASSIERVRFIASDQNYDNRNSLLQELEFAHFTAGGNGWTQVDGGALDGDGFVRIEKQFELASGRHYRVEIFTRFNPDDATAIDWRVESQYSYSADVLNNIRRHDRLTIVDFEIVRSSASTGVAVDPAVPDGAALILDTSTTPPTLREGTTQLTGPAVEREVFTRNRNQTVVFGDLHFMCPLNGGSSLQMRRGSNPSMAVTQFSTKWSNQQGGASEQVPNFTITTSWRHFRHANALNLTQHNNWQEGTFVCNGWMYRIQVIVGLSWNNNRFSCTRWRLDGVKGEAGIDGVNGIDGTDAASIDHVSKTAGDGSPGTTDTYTLWADAGETSALGTYDVPIPAAIGIQTVVLGSYSGAHTTAQSFTLPDGRTWQDCLDEFQFIYFMVGGNNLFSHDQSAQFHVSDLSSQGRDMAITDYQTHGSNAYHFRFITPAASSTTVTINNDGSSMSVQRVKVIGIK